MFSLYEIYSDGMIFPRNKEIIICGNSNESLEIEFNGSKKEVLYNNTDTFVVSFPPILEYGGPYSIKIKGKEEIKIINNIYIGEVILYAGQSNMAFKIKESNENIKLKDNNNISIFSINHVEIEEPEREYYRAKDGWQILTSSNYKELSYIGIYSALKIQEKLNCHIGVITCYQGASVIESWLPQKVFIDNEEINIDINKKHQDHSVPYYAIWNHDSCLYRFSLSKIKYYPLSFVVYYQGESDTTIEEAKIYDKELKLLISSWRELFKNDSLPFIIIQINDYTYRNDEGWHLVQQAQEKVVNETANTILVKANDYCFNEKDFIHPPHKSKLSYRIADEILSSIHK